MRPASALRLPAVRVALATALILAVPLAAMQVTDEVAWSLGDFVLAAAILLAAGALLVAAARTGARPLWNAAAIALGAAAIALGEADDAPGLVGFGGLLILAVVILRVRAARRR